MPTHARTPVLTPNTLAEAIEGAKVRAVRSIVSYCKIGWSFEDAVAKVKDGSMLGAKPWAEVIAEAKEKALPG